MQLKINGWLDVAVTPPPILAKGTTVAPPVTPLGIRIPFVPQCELRPLCQIRLSPPPSPPRSSTPFKMIDTLSPFVTVSQNFDVLLVPKDHVSRRPHDTYYANASTVLRTHTSAHQVHLMSSGEVRPLLFLFGIPGSLTCFSLLRMRSLWLGMCTGGTRLMPATTQCFIRWREFACSPRRS